jgi:hypothetical protein
MTCPDTPGGPPIRVYGMPVDAQSTGQVTGHGQFWCLKAESQPPPERFAPLAPFIPCSGQPERLITVMKAASGHT